MSVAVILKRLPTTIEFELTLTARLVYNSSVEDLLMFFMFYGVVKLSLGLVSSRGVVFFIAEIMDSAVVLCFFVSVSDSERDQM